MLNYDAADYRGAFRLASADPVWNPAERRELAAIADDDNTGESWGSGRRFRHGRMAFLAHVAATGINLGRCN